MIALAELEKPIETPNNHGYQFYPKDLQEASTYFGEFVEDWSGAYPSLVSKGFIALDGARCCLTDTGASIAERLRKERPPIWYWYKAYYIRTRDSKAHARYCEQVFGLNLCQDGFSDMKQINRLIEVAGIKSGDRILDLGCGSGMISEYISDKTGAEMHGVDYIPEAIEQAQRRTESSQHRLHFHVGNLDCIDFPEGHFDLVISIDTLYMPNDLVSTVSQMKRALRPTGSMAIYYTHFAPKGRPWRAPSAAEETDLTRAFAANHLTYRTYDFSKENYELMQRKHRVAAQLRAEYMSEGNGCLYETAYQQSVSSPEPYDRDKCRMSRYLYRVERVR